MALLDVRDLKIAFYDTTPPTEVVKGISFSLEEGETLGIVGESGSGKTQTALSILQLLKENSAVSGGEILYEGSSVAHASSQDLQRIRGKEISMIFQEPMTSLNPVLTIEEQIAEGLLIHESCTPAERHEKVLAIMHEVELPDPEKLCKKYPHQLSGGQRQRKMVQNHCFPIGQTQTVQNDHSVFPLPISRRRTRPSRRRDRAMMTRVQAKSSGVSRAVRAWEISVPMANLGGQMTSAATPDFQASPMQVSRPLVKWDRREGK